MNMRRLLFVGVLFMSVGALAAQAAVASTSGAHFMSATSSVNNSGALVVSWDEAGLGNATVNYTLTADGTAIYACINGGGNHPKAANKETTHEQVSANGTFKTKNGRVQGTLTAGPPSAGSFSCPSGQRLVLAQVTYTNIVLTDTTNSVSTSPPDVCRSFSSLFPC
jgi:hypothetical protein